jgi:secondary thiamine-phosphate synthase enzyme
MSTVIVSTKAHSEMIDITDEVRALVPSDMNNGICIVFSAHTTAGITINENADPDVRSDIVGFLDELVPWNRSAFRHFEGNSAAHIKSSLVGFSQTIPVENGKLRLGTWQGVYFCEFDGPRKRNVNVSFIGH